MKSLSKRQSSLTKLAALNWHQRLLLGKVFGVLAVYKGLLLVFPFNFFVKKTSQTTPPQVLPDERDLAEIMWAITVVSNRIPLGFTCLVQALSAKWLLRTYPAVRIHIGVHKSADQVFSAHAWVVYNNKVILGEQANQVFQPILEWN